MKEIIDLLIKYILDQTSKIPGVIGFSPLKPDSKKNEGQILSSDKIEQAINISQLDDGLFIQIAIAIIFPIDVKELVKEINWIVKDKCEKHNKKLSKIQIFIKRIK